METGLPEDTQVAILQILHKQNRVIENLSNKIGTTHPHPPFMMDPGGFQRRGFQGPRHPMRPQAHVRTAPPVGPVAPEFRRQGGKGQAYNNQDFLKQCKVYLESIKKNIPTNKDNLSMYCVACSYLAGNNQDYFSHKRTVVHMRQMNKIQKMPNSIKEDVRKVISDVFKERTAQKSLKFCELCNEDLKIPYSDHKNMISHKIRSHGVKSGCIPCETGSMKTWQEYLDHRLTESHSEKADVFVKELEEKISNCTEKSFPPFREGVHYGIAAFGTEDLQISR